MMLRRMVFGLALSLVLAACAEGPTHAEPTPQAQQYPWHHDIVATTFWVGEVLSDAPDGSQEVSAYDPNWMDNYGGCDGVLVDASCQTEPRHATNGFFPTQMSPKQNPFYLDLPLQDIRLKNRWVQLQKGEAVCYGQIQDAGPAVYDDVDYVDGTARPKNTRFNGAGMDVSPALNGCLGFAELDGANDRVSWRFVDSADVPPGPWTRIITQ